MPNPVENELGLGPVMHRLRRWSRNKLARLGNGTIPEDKRMLDPLTVNYEAWREVRRTVREWPQYKEAANSVEILVSPEDWDDYWGIDTARKEAAVAAYVRMRAKDKGYWMAGDPQVNVYCEDTIEPGELEVNCQFAEPRNEDQAFEAVSSICSGACSIFSCAAVEDTASNDWSSFCGSANWQFTSSSPGSMASSQ